MKVSSITVFDPRGIAVITYYPTAIGRHLDELRRDALEKAKRIGGYVKERKVEE